MNFFRFLLRRHASIHKLAACIVLSVCLSPLSLLSQNKPPVTFTTQQDHRNMMEQLGILTLRPGPSGNESAPNHANYDEALANPYPVLPPLLQMKDGRKVTSAAMWPARRAEIVEDFEREVIGRVPGNVPSVKWEVTVTDNERIGFIPVVAKKLVGYVDNSAYPAIQVAIKMVLVLPANVKGPVPVLVMFGGGNNLPAPSQPNQEAMDKLNEALKTMLIRSDTSVKAIFEKYPAYTPMLAATPTFPAPLAAGQDPPTHQQLVAAGWGYAQVDPASIQADNGAGLTRGIIGLVNKGQPRKPDDWGALRAWAWGAARVLDYLQTEPMVNKAMVGIEGVSRYGKAALVTLAFEPGFSMALVGSSGEGGAKLHRRNFGEAVESLTGSGEYHWMAGNFLKYGTATSAFGAKTANDIPVDAHQLIALCAPKLTFISYGVPEQGDARWLDQQGSFMATVAAGEAFRLLGAKDLGITEPYQTAKMPPVLTGLLEGELAWRQHAGGHTDAPNVKTFIEWVNRKTGYKAVQ